MTPFSDHERRPKMRKENENGVVLCQKMMSSEEMKSELTRMKELGIISQDAVAEAMKKITKQQQEEVLKVHKNPIYQGDRGRWMTYVRDLSCRNNRRLIAKTHYDDLVEALYDFYTGKAERERLETMSLEDIYPLWLEEKSKRPNSEEYISRIGSDWKRFYEGTELARKPVRELDKKYVKNWVENLIKNNGLNTKQYSNAITILKQGLRYAEEEDIIVKSPFDLIHIDCRKLCASPAVKKARTEVLTPDEKKSFYELAMSDFENEVKEYRLSPLASIFMFETGVRVSEVCAVRFEDIQGSEIIVCSMLKRDSGRVVPYTKGHRYYRPVPLTSRAKNVIELARQYQNEHGSQADGYIFSMTEQPANYRSITSCFSKYSVKCSGIRKSSHKARKTYISTLLDNENISGEAVREAVGHAKISTTYDSYYYDRKAQIRSELFEKALEG